MCFECYWPSPIAVCYCGPWDVLLTCGQGPLSPVPGACSLAPMKNGGTFVDGVDQQERKEGRGIKHREGKYGEQREGKRGRWKERNSKGMG